MNRLYFFKYFIDTNNLYSHAAISGEQTLDQNYVHVECGYSIYCQRLVTSQNETHKTHVHVQDIAGD